MSKTRVLHEVHNDKIERLEKAVAALCELLEDTNPHIAEELSILARVVNSPLPD